MEVAWGVEVPLADFTPVMATICLVVLTQALVGSVIAVTRPTEPMRARRILMAPQTLPALTEVVASLTPDVLTGIEQVLLKSNSVDKVTVTGRTPVLGSMGNCKPLRINLLEAAYW